MEPAAHETSIPQNRPSQNRGRTAAPAKHDKY
ncbi:hypothetical protein BMYO_1540 [Bifidobacterium myosotis]|uniref:Uncharacterized protein n=1 Tax=Bifidobacterium myosotis TaxID=1630166 RepID=A0A261FIP5_9BIFI|nr:hypothetical protein BMYO_1540 [Bifidobacterium myosotis]